MSYVKRTVIVFEFSDGTFDATDTVLRDQSTERNRISSVSGAEAVGFVAQLIGDPVREAARVLAEARNEIVDANMEVWDALDRLHAVLSADPVKTASGRWLNNADFEALADEAERGYEHLIHKAVPVDGDESHCAHCGQAIRRVTGGQGPIYVHSDSGAVAAPNPPDRREP